MATSAKINAGSSNFSQIRQSSAPSAAEPKIVTMMLHLFR